MASDLDPQAVKEAIEDVLCTMPHPGPRFLAPSTVETLYETAKAWLLVHDQPSQWPAFFAAWAVAPPTQ